MQMQHVMQMLQHECIASTSYIMCLCHVILQDDARMSCHVRVCDVMSCHVMMRVCHVMLHHHAR